MTTSIEVPEQAFTFFEESLRVIVNHEAGTVEGILNILPPFMAVYEKEQAKLPYHINLLDLLWANENAHSRILSELLKQNEGGNFEILGLFYAYLAKKFPKIKFPSIAKPQITTEKERIDLLILEKDFALIIENKIHNAVDQNSQIARYIQKVKYKGYKDENIHVVYLTRDGNKAPEDQSWIEGGIDYKSGFKERFFPLSFRDDILPWLQDTVLPNCRLKDVFLRSAIEQYIDHLQGLFYNRKINETMNAELQKKLEELVGLKDINSIDGKRDQIKKKLEDLKMVESHLNILLNENGKMFYERWAKEMKETFPNDEIINEYDEKKKYKHIGIKLIYKDLSFNVISELNCNSGTVYYGIGCRYCNPEKKHDSISLFFKEHFKDGFTFSDDKLWYCWKYSENIDTSYSNFIELIKNVKQLLGPM